MLIFSKRNLQQTSTWQNRTSYLRQTVKRVYNLLPALRVPTDSDQTCLGASKKGLNFRGFHRSPTSTHAKVTLLSQPDKKITRLYEQSASLRRIGLSLALWLGLGALAYLSIAPIASAEVISKSMKMKNYTVESYATLGALSYLNNRSSDVKMVVYNSNTSRTHPLCFSWINTITGKSTRIPPTTRQGPCFTFVPKHNTTPKPNLFKKTSVHHYSNRVIFLLYDHTVFELTFTTTSNSRYEQIMPAGIALCHAKRALTTKGCTTTTSRRRARLKPSPSPTKPPKSESPTKPPKSDESDEPDSKSKGKDLESSSFESNSKSKGKDL